ncbi:hypothetical protein GCM10008938_29560 [Deinococcus roseus]|uniref:Uncharacterized protein n=1 Tax=Deinococcus roseus TaxID=392414 RepID=A0ABQ2D3M4_9DEIO|nr:hypothetical protein GCM10008938_29560 [Deinococcus roseus]
MKVRFGLPEHGWIALTIENGSLKACIDADSRFEAFDELIEALRSMHSGEENAVATWYEEPNLTELHFQQTPEKIQLSCVNTRIYDLADQSSDQSFVVEGRYGEICLPFVQALLVLRKAVAGKRWLKLAQDDFPEDEFQEFLELLKADPELELQLKM